MMRRAAFSFVFAAECRLLSPEMSGSQCRFWMYIAGAVPAKNVNKICPCVGPRCASRQLAISSEVSGGESLNRSYMEPR